MSRPALHLLGCPTLFDASGVPLAGGPVQRHRIALLALLAIASPKGVSRDRIVGLLWPDRDAGAARRLLNVAIAVLRQALGPEAIVSAGDDLRLGENALTVDVHEFERAADEGRLEAAVELSRGPFLEGFFLDDVEEFERWVDSHRLRLARRYTAALAVLAERATTHGNLVNAVAWWRALSHAEPTNSKVVVQLFDALVASGDVSGALAVAEAHAAYMRSEIGIEPDTELLQRGNALRSSLTAARADVDVPRVVAVKTPPETPPYVPPAPRRRALAIAASVTVLAIGSAVVFQATAGGRPAPAAHLVAAIEPLAADTSVPDAVREQVMRQLVRNLEQIDGVDVAINAKPKAHDNTSFRVHGRLRRNDGQWSASFTVVDSTGSSIGTADATADDDASGVLPLVDKASLELVRLMWGRRWRVPAPRVAAITTASLPALEAFMRGEMFFRRLVYDSAARAFEAAVHLDSTFALANFRLGEVNAWRNGMGRPATLEPLDQALRHVDKLTDREAALLRLYIQHERTDWNAYATAQQVIERYADDPDARYLMADVVFHSRTQRGVDLVTQYAMWDRAIESDAVSLRPLEHVFDLAIAEPTPERYDHYLTIRRSRLGADQEDARVRLRAMRWGPLRAARDSMHALVRIAAADRRTTGPVLQARDALVRRCFQGTEDCGNTVEWYVEMIKSNFNGRPGQWSWEAATRTAMTFGVGVVTPSNPAYTNFETIARLIVFGYAPPAMIDTAAKLLEAGRDRTWKYQMRRAQLAMARGEIDAAAAAVDSAVRLVDAMPADKQAGLAYIPGYARAMRGWMMAAQGDTARGIGQLRTGIAEAGYSGIAVEVMTPFIDLLGILISTQAMLREEGIVRLRNNLGASGLYWPWLRLVLARALDANGNAREAAEEYDRFARLWQNANPEYRKYVEEARNRSRELRRR